MSSCDSRLANDVSLTDDVLLVNRNHHGRNLNTKVATGNHDAISSFQDGIDIVIAFLVLDLGNDVDVRLAHLNADLTDCIDIACSSDKGSEDKINVHFTAELDIIDILFGQERHGELDTWHVAALMGADRTSNLNSALHLRAIVLKNGQSHLAIVDKDIIASLQIIEQFRALDPETLMCTFTFSLGQINNLTDLIVLGIILEVAKSDFRSLCIQSNCQCNASCIRYMSDCFNSCLMFFMCAMREVHAGNVHTCIGKFCQYFNTFRSRANGADNSCLLEDVLVVSHKIQFPLFLKPDGQTNGTGLCGSETDGSVLRRSALM